MSIVLNRNIYLVLLLLFFGFKARAAEDSQVGVVSAAAAIVVPQANKVDFNHTKWIGFGLALGAAGLLSACLIWNAGILRTSVWASHMMFIGMSVAILAYLAFLKPLKGVAAQNDLMLAGMLRGQLVLSVFMLFPLLSNGQNKQKIGLILSALVGGTISTSALQFLLPDSVFVHLATLLLILCSLYFGIRQFIAESSKSVFFQLSIIAGIGSSALWLPDAQKLATEAYTLLVCIQLMLYSAVAGALWSTLEELNAGRIGTLKREVYSLEKRLHGQTQMVQLLQADCKNLEIQLHDEAKFKRQDELREGLKLKALEEMSQDIALGMISYLKEMDYACHTIMNECKSPKFRLHRIRAFAERSSQLATRVQEVLGFLQRKDEVEPGKLINASDLLTECLRICHDKILRNSVEVEIESYDKDLWLEGKLTILAQGFLGLLYNALEATETSDVRRVTIKLQKVQVDQQAWAQLSVTNSGHGIPTFIKAKAFHSKKREGLGAHSLGLSMAFGIFETYGGSLELDTDAVATTFIARMPLCPKDEDYSVRLVI